MRRLYINLQRINVHCNGRSNGIDYANIANCMCRLLKRAITQFNRIRLHRNADLSVVAQWFCNQWSNKRNVFDPDRLRSGYL